MNHERFPHLATHKYMTKIYYKENEVMQLEPMKWVRGVEKVKLFHMPCIPHFHKSIINTVCVHQLLALVHDGCLCLGEPITIMDMLIHRIKNLPYKGVDPAKEFGGKSGEKEMEDKMKAEFGLVNKSCGYSIHSIKDHTCSFPPKS